MPLKPASLDHVNIYVRNAERSCRWYTDVLGLEETDSIDRPNLRIAFLAADRERAHEIALMEVGKDAPGPQQRQVGLNHFAWKMGSLDDLKAMYLRLKQQLWSTGTLARAHRWERLCATLRASPSAHRRSSLPASPRSPGAR